MAGLEDETRSGRPRCIDDDAVAEVIRKTLEATPRDATHWSTRSMARATGYCAVDDPPDVAGLFPAPHRSETFKLSADPYFVQGARHRRTVRGPATACPGSLCGREVAGSGPRSHPAPAAAAARTRSSDALMTTSAMARHRWPPSTSPPGRSSDSATGATAARSSGSSWITSRPTFRPTSTSTSSWRNYSTHKTKTIRDWFARRPRWHVHFTPTSASWLNQVEWLLRRSDGKADPARRSPIERRAGTGNRRLIRDRQRRPKARSDGTSPLDDILASIRALLPQDHRNRSGRRIIRVHLGIRTLEEAGRLVKYIIPKN